MPEELKQIAQRIRELRESCDYTPETLAKELGIDRALVTCDKNNPASAKTILRCGGVLEDERLENGELVQRYWITI